MMNKICSRCKQDLPVENFHKWNRSKDGHQSWCKKCNMEYGQNYGKDIRGFNMRKNARLRRKYGFSLEKYDNLLKSQKGVCKICGKKGTYCSLHLDHDHQTGAIRGLLCYNCNRGLGHFQDNTNLLRKAIEYLQQKTGLFVGGKVGKTLSLNSQDPPEEEEGK